MREPPEPRTQAAPGARPASAPAPPTTTAPTTTTAPGGGGDATGTSEADVIGLIAVGTQFGLAGLQAADATVRLASGPVRAPGLMLALAMAGERGWAVLGRMQEVALLRGDQSLARAAWDVGMDGVTLGAAALRFMAADDGFLTDPVITVPLDRAEGVDVERRVTFTFDGDVTYEGINVAAGTQLVVEYLANGLVRVSLRGDVRLGGELASSGAGGISAGAGPLAGVSWLVADEREASRFVALLALAGGASAASHPAVPMALGLSGAVAPIPLPQTVTVGASEVVQGSLTAGQVTAGAAEVRGTGQVTIDADGNRSYEVRLEGQLSASLAGPVLDGLPPDVRAQLPGGATWTDPDVFEAAGEVALEVRTDARNDVESVTVTLGASAGQGTGLSTSVASAQSTAGEKVEVTIELDADELRALGPPGQRVLAALAQNRPDLAAAALGEIGGAIAGHASDPDYSRYTTVSNGGGIERGAAGVSGGGSVTIEETEDDELGARPERPGRTGQPG